MYDGMEHYCLEGNHIVNLFSFSKAYGMMGWRVGYVSLPLSLSLFHPLLRLENADVRVNIEFFQFHEFPAST
jgi:aspartate/methionine/tyrosine aminotransferase